jgi:flagellar hook protein FlgE
MPMPPITLATANGNLQVSLDFGGTTQVGTSFAMNSISQDGYGEGKIQEASEFMVLADGHISARYSNGQRRNVAQVVLANFTNPNALVNLGDNQWTTNDDPCAARDDHPGLSQLFDTEDRRRHGRQQRSCGGHGFPAGVRREQSNVDLGGTGGPDRAAAQLPGQRADIQDPRPGACRTSPTCVLGLCTSS